MSSATQPNARKAPISLTRSISNLPAAIIKKLTGGDKIAPLLIAPKAEDEEDFDDAVELACGHIFCTKNANDNKARGATFGLLSGRSGLANLSIFEATRCPICESSKTDEAVSVRGANGSA